MKIKVCGMKYPDNIKELSLLSIDFIGFIFYKKSVRYIENLSPEVLNAIPDKIKRVGVFVNENIDSLIDKVKKYNLDYIQLHGNESVEYIIDLKAKDNNIKIIKAFSISDLKDLEQTKDYESVSDYFLFDTKTPHYGGSGKKFDWNILKEYKGEKSFFLSGGISSDDKELINKLNFPKLFALDLNSKFETEPAIKNISLLKKFI